MDLSSNFLSGMIPHCFHRISFDPVTIFGAYYSVLTLTTPYQYRVFRKVIDVPLLGLSNHFEAFVLSIFSRLLALGLKGTSTHNRWVAHFSKKKEKKRTDNQSIIKCSKAFTKYFLGLFSSFSAFAASKVIRYLLRNIARGTQQGESKQRQPPPQFVRYTRI